MVLAMGEAMIFVVDSDEAVGQCDDEDMRKLEALAANKNDETAAVHSMSSSGFLIHFHFPIDLMMLFNWLLIN